MTQYIFYQFPVTCFSQHKQGPEFARGNCHGIQKEKNSQWDNIEPYQYL